MQSGSRKLPADGQQAGVERTRLLKNGAAAHAFTREDRAKGGRARAEKLRRRKELREQFQVDDLEELASPELGLLSPAVVRLNSLLASEDDRVALRAAIEVFDRVLGRPKQQPPSGHSFERPDMDAALASAHEKLAERLGPTLLGT